MYEPPPGVPESRALTRDPRAAVILSADDPDSIMETLDILNDSELVREIRTAEAEAERGEVYSLDEVAEEMRAHGRLPR